MRLVKLGLLGLALLASCKRGPAPSPDPPTSPADTQTAAIALELLTRAGAACDALQKEIWDAWTKAEERSSSPVDGAVPARNLLSADPAIGVEISMLEAEAERRVAALEARHDPMAENVSKAYAATRNHCAAVAYPKTTDRGTYNRAVVLAWQTRARTLNGSLQQAPPRDLSGDQEVRLVAERIRAAQRAATTPAYPSAPASPAPER